jgi:predicted RNA-binding protein with PUA domain
VITSTLQEAIGASNSQTEETMHTILLLNSNPGFDNENEIVMSEEFEAYADAKSAYENFDLLPQGMQSEIRSAKIQGYELWIELDSDKGYECKRICEETAEYRRREDAAWRSEQAMQAGMAFGCQGYNDFMGY